MGVAVTPQGRRRWNTLELRMLALALAIALSLSLLSPHFLTRTNLFNLLDQSVVIGLVAIGMTLVILTGGIDLSVGSVAGLTGIVLGLALSSLPIPLAIAAAILTGAGIGLLSGILVAGFGLAPFVVTLGMMAIARSLAYILSGQTVISAIPENLSLIVYASFLGIPANVLFLLAMYAVAWLYLNHAKGGRTIYAIGSTRMPPARQLERAAPYSISPPSRPSPSRSPSQLRSADPMGNLWGWTPCRLPSRACRPGLHSRHPARHIDHGDDPQWPEPARRLAGVRPSAPSSSVALDRADRFRRSSADRRIHPQANPSAMEPIPASARAACRVKNPGPAPERRTRGRQPAHIRHGAIEILRAISFIVRDRDWGTYAPRILGLSEHAEHFDVSYEACDDCVQRLSIRYPSPARPWACVSAAARAPRPTFETNRRLRHPAPIDGVAGRPATITHVDGRVARPFSELIAPTQPALRAIAHEPAAGLRIA